MGQFLLGFVIGATIGAVAVLATTPQSGDELRHGLTASLETGQKTLSERLNAASQAFRQASAATEQDLWNTYRQRVQKPDDGQLPS
jgi:gas vesicle protein